MKKEHQLPMPLLNYQDKMSQSTSTWQQQYLRNGNLSCSNFWYQKHLNSKYPAIFISVIHLSITNINLSARDLITAHVKIYYINIILFKNTLFAQHEEGIKEYYMN